jgi:dTMP kinase
MSGHYVALEGVEGAGKTTIAGALAARLRDRGFEVVVVREPGGTTVGEGVRELLLHGDHLEPWAEALLFAAQRAQLAAEVIRPALEAGAWVVSDRTVYSSLAYQGAARRLGIDEVRSVNAAGLEGTWPDLVVLLRLDEETGLGRQEAADRIGGEGLEFQREVGAAFDRLAETEPEVFRVVDATGTFEEVLEAVVAVVEERW